MGLVLKNSNESFDLQKDICESKDQASAALKDADTALQYALTMFPSALLPLLDKCSIEADPRAATHSFFLEGHGFKGLEVLVGLYVQRSHHIWKDPVLLPWLERNVNAVLDTVAANSEFVKDCATKRKSRYQVGTNSSNFYLNILKVLANILSFYDCYIVLIIKVHPSS